MENKLVKGFLIKKVVFLFFFLFNLSAISSAEGLFFPGFTPENQSPITSFGYYQGTFGLNPESSGSTYSPFNPGSTQENPFLDPVLYGPGGEPIGGLPVSGGSVLLLLATVCYAIVKLIKKNYFNRYSK